MGRTGEAGAPGADKDPNHRVSAVKQTLQHTQYRILVGKAHKGHSVIVCRLGQPLQSRGLHSVWRGAWTAFCTVHAQIREAPTISSLRLTRHFGQLGNSQLEGNLHFLRASGLALHIRSCSFAAVSSTSSNPARRNYLRTHTRPCTTCSAKGLQRSMTWCR